MSHNELSHTIVQPVSADELATLNMFKNHKGLAMSALIGESITMYSYFNDLTALGGKLLVRGLTNDDDPLPFPPLLKQESNISKLEVSLSTAHEDTLLRLELETHKSCATIIAEALETHGSLFAVEQIGGVFVPELADGSTQAAVTLFDILSGHEA